MAHPYSVALVDAEGLPTAARIAAESRYSASLERSLGGADEVNMVLRAFRSAEDSGVADLDKATIARAMRWPRAANLATQAAFRDLGEFPGAHFEVKPSRV